MKTVTYKGEVLASGSDAYQLYMEKDKGDNLKKLDEHLKMVNLTKQKLEGATLVSGITLYKSPLASRDPSTFVAVDGRMLVHPDDWDAVVSALKKQVDKINKTVK